MLDDAGPLFSHTRGTTEVAMFEAGEMYTREQIHEALGGSMQSYLPHLDGRVVCACLRPDTDPDAPTVILVGAGKGIEAGAEMLAAQGGSIPVFLKRAQNRWEYAGQYRMERSTRGTAEIEARVAQVGA